MKQNKIRIYANPTKDDITIEGNKLNNQELEIFNTEGRLISTTRLKDNKSTISLKTLSKGVYLLNIKDNNERKYRQKLIKN